MCETSDHRRVLAFKSGTTRICHRGEKVLHPKVGGVDDYNIKQLSPAILEKEGLLLDSRQRDNSPHVSIHRGPSVNLRTASRTPTKRLAKKMAYQPRYTNLLNKRITILRFAQPTAAAMASASSCLLSQTFLTWESILLPILIEELALLSCKTALLS
ncbi:uncharacterized protein B0J16DRAFT_393573 [Fusarium flagelliforme]|uniref:uncharacterized protein n=1 Tax=Fusarium flagelliforme TaxID=2675880 RepID=UPI001E8EBC33|nr:uncharacterized protein B0J16DRAFT_393573 [Fusarium flagelliforme]KAH7169644.1 hypothetical protein B0J16DRAFT_393573 [Fusarium flagelliforme]